MTSHADLLAQDFSLIADLVAANAVEIPDHIAVVDGDERISFAAFDRLADRVAAALQRDGVAAGSVVAICAASSIAYAAVFLGALRAGVAVSPLAPSSTPASLTAMVADCGTRLLFLDTSTREVCAAATGPSVGRIALDNTAGDAPFAGWLAPDGATRQPVAIAADAPFNIIYSSGTTGAPKGIVQSHGMRWQHVRRGGLFGYGRDSVAIVSTPLYSNTTLVSFFPTLALGGTLVLMRKFDVRGFLALAERQRATHAMLVPVQYQRLLAAPEFARADLSSFRMKFATSAPFPAALKAEVLKRWPGGLVEYYGMTEGGGTCILLAHEFPDKLATVGRPSEGHDIRLIGEDGREVAPGELGEVVGRSPAMMSGYHNQPVKTAEAVWHDAEGRRYIRTGDVGRFDADGFLTLYDRKKDMIISGGFNVYPSDLEAVLREHPAVAEAAVVGVPSEQWGETPVAFVVTRPGATVTAEDLRAAVNAQVGKTQRLADVRIVEDLPRNAIGKVLKRELRENYRMD